MVNHEISFASAKKNDFEDFRRLRKSVMLEHVERQGLSWNDGYHEELFSLPGLRVIFVQGQRVGYIGVHEEREGIILDRLCLLKEKQCKGIGTQVMRMILEEKQNQGKPMVLEVLKRNPAVSLYERLGFKKVSEDEILVTLQRPAQNTLKNNPGKPNQ